MSGLPPTSTKGTTCGGKAGCAFIHLSLCSTPSDILEIKRYEEEEAMIVFLVVSLSNCLKTFFLMSKSSIILSCIKIEFLQISSIEHLRTMFDFIFSILS